MAGYIGSKASVVSSGAERKKTFTITGATTSLTGLNYTVGKVHVFQNGVRLVDGTDYTATNGTTITLTTAAQSGDNVVVISQASYQVADAVLTSGDSMTGDLSFGDNDKAIFGAGSDLQIYHDGSNSIIHDNGTGNLQIRAGNLNILNATATENYLSADNGGAVNLFYNNSKKFETTSTGIDVTGTLTCDGLTVDATPVRFNATAPMLNFMETGVADSNHRIRQNAGNFYIQKLSDDEGTATDRLIIDGGSGTLLVNKSSSGGNSTGFESRSTGDTLITRDGGRSLYLNRKSDDGEIIAFYKDGSSAGSIGSRGGPGLFINSQSGDLALSRSSNERLYMGNTAFYPVFDNSFDLGGSGNRYDDIYATNGTIQTSDFNEKQDIASLTATEMLVGKRISALFKTFRWKDSVAEKGDNARTHTGVIAQDVQAAFTAEGLDAGDYALFISSTWWETQTEVPAVEAVSEVTDEDGNVTTEAVEAKEAYTRTDTYDTEDEAPEGATSKTRMGIRYPELLSFVAAYNEQRFASIEARLTALEG